MFSAPYTEPSIFNGSDTHYFKMVILCCMKERLNENTFWYVNYLR